MTMELKTDVAAGAFAILGGLILIGAHLGLWWHPPETAAEVYWRVGFVIVGTVIAAIIIGIWGGIFQRDEAHSDERESLIQMKSLRNTVFVYAGGNAIVLMEAFEISNRMNLVHGCIAIVVVAELTRIGSLFYYMRMGA